jgi:hypothetical protein
VQPRSAHPGIHDSQSDSGKLLVAGVVPPTGREKSFNRGPAIGTATKFPAKLLPPLRPGLKTF